MVIRCPLAFVVFSLFIVFSILESLPAPKIHRRFSRNRLRIPFIDRRQVPLHKYYGLKSSNSEADNVSRQDILLPIVQIIDNGALIGEFICGSDVASCELKFPAMLRSIVSGDNKQQRGQYNVRNIYSDEMLDEALTAAGKTAVLLLHRSGCKKCQQFDALFHDMAGSSDFSDSFEWFVAEVDVAPLYLKKLVLRLEGRRDTFDADNNSNSNNISTNSSVISSNDIVDCAVCENTGFVQCAECGGIGIVQRGAALAVRCPSCCGYTRTRCDNCGGKCIQCVV